MPLEAMTAGEVVDKGVLAELNRRFLRPLGAVAAVSWERLESPVLYLTIWTPAPIELGAEATDEGYRQADLERWQAIDELVTRDPRKAERMRRAEVHAASARQRLGLPATLGVEGLDESEPVSVADDDATLGRLVALCGEALSGAELTDEAREELAGNLLRAFASFLADLHLGADGALRIRPKPPIELAHERIARAEWQILGLAADPGELYPQEALRIAALAGKLEGGQPLDAEDVLESEMLYGLSFPGMRFWRGDAEERERILGRAREIEDFAKAWAARRGDAAKFLAGHLAAADVPDPEALHAELESRAEELRELLAPAESEVAALRTALIPVEDALRRLAEGR